MRGLKLCSGDWVTTATGGRGIVLRVAKDGTWADVRWRRGEEVWIKRMPPDALIIQTTLPLAGGFEVTDLTRAKELGKDVEPGEHP